MPMYEIPLTPEPQNFNISLAGIGYFLELLWNPSASAWQLNLSSANRTKIVSSIPLVTGSNLLEQLAYLGIGGSLFCSTDHDLTAPPTFDNLGVTGHLYFETT